MEATQMINDSILESDEDENEGNTNKRGEPLAKLRILKNQHIPQTELPLFLGDNVLGRDPSSCTLNLPAPSVSKQHATICISVYRRRGGQNKMDMEALVWDLGSMNGTRKGHLKLTPNVRYALSEGDSLVVADIPCQYVSWSAHTTSSQGDTRTPVSQNSEFKAHLPDTSRENDADTSTGSKKCDDRDMKTPVSLRSPGRGSCLSIEKTPNQPQTTLVPESDSDSDGEREGKVCRSRNTLVSDSYSHKSSPNSSTFLSPENKTIPESEDESLITPSSSRANRPHRHVSFTTEEIDEDAGRQKLHKANAVKNMSACEEDKGRQEQRASEGVLLTPGRDNSNVSLSGEVESPVSNPVIPAFNMDSDTDVEGEEEGVVSAGVESAVPIIVNTNQQADRPPDTVQFHLDSDTDNDRDENEDILRKAPEVLPSHENPQVISVSVIAMDSDTDVDEDAAVSDAATNVKPTSFQSASSADSVSSVPRKDFHLDSDTDAEEEEERGAKPQNPEKHETSKLDIKLIGPNSTSAAPNSLHLNSDTDDETVPGPSANKPSSAAAVTELIPATDVGADLDILSDSDTDVEDNVPLVTRLAVQTLAGTMSKPSQSDSDADTDVDEPGMPPTGNQADQIKKVDSDTDVDYEDMNNVVAGVDQISRLKGQVAPATLVPLPQLKCSTPLPLPEEVAEMETQAFMSPLSGTIRSPPLRPAALSSFRERLEDEDLLEAETQAFIPNTWECKNSSQTFILDSSVDKNNQSSRGESLRLGLSESDHLQRQDHTGDLETTHVEETQAKASVSAEKDSKGPQAHQMDEELEKCSSVPKKEEQRNLDLEATQPYISELCNSDLEDTADEGDDQNDAPTETEPFYFGTPSTIAMAETQLISSPVREEITTSTSHNRSIQQTRLAVHDIGATQPMANCDVVNSDSEDCLTITRKRNAKKLHIEDETQEFTNSELSVAETQPLAPSEEDDDDEDDRDSIIGPRKRKSKPLQIENETQSLPGSEVSTVDTQPLGACEAEKRDEEDLSTAPHKTQAKQLQGEMEQTQPLRSSDASTLKTVPAMTANDQESENKGCFSGKSKEKQLHLTEEETQPLSDSDVFTVENQLSNTETDPQNEEENVKQSENSEARSEFTEVKRQTRSNSRKEGEQEECTDPPKRRTRGQRKSLPSTKGKKGRASADEDKEEVNQTNGAERKNTTELQKDEDRRLVNKSIAEGEEENLENKSKAEVQHEILRTENAETTRLEAGKKKKENDMLDCEKVGDKQEPNKCNRSEEEEKHLEIAEIELEENETKKQEQQAHLERKAKEQANFEKQNKAGDENLKELKEQKADQKQTEQQTPRGRGGRRTVAARSTVSLESSPDDVPAKRTRSRSNSSNSVSSERSASSMTNQESKGRVRGRARRASRTSETPHTAVRNTRTTGAAGAAQLDKGDAHPQGLISTSIMSNSLNADTSSSCVSSQNRGRRGKQRVKEAITETCSESGASVITQSPQPSAPAARGKKGRKTEVIHEDEQSKTESKQSSTTRGRRRTSASDSQPSEKDHTAQGGDGAGEESLLSQRNIRGRVQKIEKSEGVREALVSTISDCKDAKPKNGKRRQSECGSNHAEKIPKTEAPVEESKDIIQGTTSSATSGSQTKPNTKTSPDAKVVEKETCETETVQRKTRGRQSVAAKNKREESRESEASASSVEPDAPELPETPSNRASRKRQATTDSSLSAKSVRSSTASPVASSRRQATSQTYRVLFTGMEDEEGERVLARLGGVMAKGVADMNCLVTDKVRRTVKFLCAVAKGIPVVTTEWLEKSGKSGSFLSPSAFLVKDADQEKKFSFSLEESLSAASSQPLLQGYEIHVTKSVLPQPVQMKEIIACSGATFLPKMPSSQKPHTVVVSCEKDWPLCGPALSASLPVVTAEFILTGILQQKIDFQTHELCLPTPNLQAAGGRGRSKTKI